jgi:hypothetical protein
MPKPVMAIPTAQRARPGGAMFQFTHGYRCPVADSTLDELGLKASRTATVLVNAPPASVYKIERGNACMPRITFRSSAVAKDGAGCRRWHGARLRFQRADEPREDE